MKNRTEVPTEKLKLGEILEKPWTYLTVDFITKLLLVAGKDTILVVCDSVIVRECGQTLGLGLVDRNRTVVNY